MRINFLKRIVGARFVRGACWLVAGGIWSSAQTVLRAEAPAESAASRLGIHFDQQVHDASVAAKKAAGEGVFSAEPHDPGVIRLPKYVVTDERFPLEEYELLTPKGRVAVAEKRYLSPIYRKTVGPLAAIATFLNNPLGGWSPNAPEAMAIYEDFEGVRRRARTKELMNLADLADRAKPEKVKEPSEKSARSNKR
jgi:hypothetical protein